MKIITDKKEIEKTLSGPTIIMKNPSGSTNTASAVDGIGALRGSFPGKVYAFIGKHPEFQWVLETNSNMELFTQLNPWLDIRYRAKVKDIPAILINRDGNAYVYDAKRYKGHAKN